MTGCHRVYRVFDDFAGKVKAISFLWLDTLPGCNLVTGCTGCHRVLKSAVGQFKLNNFPSLSPGVPGCSPRVYFSPRVSPGVTGCPRVSPGVTGCTGCILVGPLPILCYLTTASTHFPTYSLRASVFLHCEFFRIALSPRVTLDSH